MSTLLVVDDEPLALQLFRSVLEKRGFHVLAAANAAEALNLFDARRSDIDLLVTDIVMPEKDGTELARDLVARNPGLPVLFMSGYVSEEEVERARPVRRFAFLRKPFRPQALVQAVQKMLTGEDEVA